MPSISVSQCDHCGLDATTKCSGCHNAPEYAPGDAGATAYCSKECQKAHWPSHKARCHNMRKRRRLHRAAIVLKKSLLAYRECVFDIRLTKIELRDGVLYLHQRPHLPTSRSYHGPFPSHLVSNERHKEAALVNNQCTASLAILSRLSYKLLAGSVTTRLDNMDVAVDKPIVPTKLTPAPQATSELGASPHSFIKATLFSLSVHEEWIIDPAGAQFGFVEALAPYRKYMAEKDCTVVNGPEPYRWTETKDLEYFDSLGFLIATRAQREASQWERRNRLHFAKFVDDGFAAPTATATAGGSGGVYRDILEGSPAEFDMKIDRFEEDLKAHMRNLAA